MDTFIAKRFDQEIGFSCDHRRNQIELVLNLLQQYRRPAETNSCLDLAVCGPCGDSLRSKFSKAIRLQKPLQLLLPAFPCKSPNPMKVIGKTPDRGEQEALRTLNRLCAEIESVYHYGVELILGCDGRVFSDLIGVADDDVTEYQSQIGNMIEAFNLHHIKLLTLDSVFPLDSYDQRREKLVIRLGDDLTALKERILLASTGSGSVSDAEALMHYRGVIKFLEDDLYHLNQDASKRLRHRLAKDKAIHVLHRSLAWGSLLQSIHPDAVRLSIHPQKCGSGKLGVKLIGPESWITPWHGVLVDGPSGLVLMKRYQAESLGATLIADPKSWNSYYKI
jgi:L-tyrosine isonitrile synthase